MSPDNRDFAADVRYHVDVHIIPKYEDNMPLRLADTYTGLILERSEIISLLKMRRDYNEKLEDVVREAESLATLIDPDRPFDRPKLNNLDTFIAEYLAFAMFSHRWRGREPALEDVRKAPRGIYSMRGEDLVEENQQALHFPKYQDNDPPSGVQKLQEFCCLAAKCGFRWAWSDTCCINKKDFSETSESINCMFLWYRSSYLTIVYLDDVDEVENGRLPPVDEDGSRWFEDVEMKKPLPPSDQSAPPTPSDIYNKTLETQPYRSLHDRLRDGTSPQLQSMHPDSQVEESHLRAHLDDNFPSVDFSKTRGKHRKLPVWVTRGWTLQEMIASKRLRFYSKRWTLLEEADDRDTDEAEKNMFIPSFRYRARLVDHRTCDMWGHALVNTTGVPLDELRHFRVGTRDVRSRLLWAAKRTTTKVEDRAYCLLGIFDISLPAMYGEGPRAFFRLQEELIKRTGDVTVFDWCGRSSSINSFLAYNPGCFIEPSLPDPHIEDTIESIFWMIVNIFRAIVGTAWTAIKAAITKARDWIKRILHSPPPGHCIVNGELNVSVFEHRVRCCEESDDAPPNDPYHHYKLVADGLDLTKVVVLASHASNLMKNPTQYYLCRTWSRHTENVFQILLDLIEYCFQEKWNEFWGENDDELDSSTLVDEDDCPESRLREEMQMKRKEVKKFFDSSFPVYLVHVKDGRRVRASTMNRVEGKYLGFDFTMPVVMRSIL